NNHLYQYQNKKLQHRLSFLLGIPFPQMKESYGFLPSCVISHVLIRAAMFSRFVTRHSAASNRYDSSAFPYRSTKTLCRGLLLSFHFLYPAIMRIQTAMILPISLTVVESTFCGSYFLHWLSNRYIQIISNLLHSS